MIWQALSDGFTILIEKWPLVLAVVSVIGLGLSPSFFLSRHSSGEEKLPWQSVGLLAFFFSASIILRMAFLTDIFVPPYFDSAEHYRIIKGLVTAMGSSALLKTIPSLTPNYYHLGFHLLASFLTFSLHANPIDTILVLGQVILAAIPIPLFFLIRHETKNDIAAFFGILLAGFGWYMPGFAVNWGKYPALAGLLALEIVLSIAYFTSSKEASRNRLLWIGFLILAIFVSTLFHTRTLIVIAISFASWFLAGKLQSWIGKIRLVSLVIFLGGILALGILIWKNPLLKLTLEPYLADGIWVTLAVGILSPFAIAKFPRAAYFNILFIFSVFVTLFISVGNWLPGFENQTLLDRPFVEMILYLPLSVLGALGLAGLLQALKDISALPKRVRLYARILTTVVVLCFASLIPISNYNFYSSDCCNFVKYEDTVALDWMETHLPPDAHILIPSTQLNVLPSGPSDSLTGTDAGIWIPALTGKNATPAPFDLDFHAPDTLKQLCQQDINYVYVGGTDQSFNGSQLQTKGDWYEAVFYLSNVQVYQIIGCSSRSE